MKTIKKVIQEVVNRTLDEYGVLAGDLSVALSDRIWTAIQERKERRGEACPVEWMTGIYWTCRIDASTASPGLRQQVSECGKALVNSGADIRELQDFVIWWREHIKGWSVRCDDPSPKQIRDNWGKFKNTESSSKVLVVK